MKMAKSKEKCVLSSGKRKTAIARAKIVKGSGVLRINRRVLEEYVGNEAIALRILEPLIISGLKENYDLLINVRGGGQSSQADAIRQAIANGLIEITGDEDLKEKFLSYDRALLVADTRFKETNKPNTSKARAKRQKSYR